jgi:hypothetical protein
LINAEEDFGLTIVDVCQRGNSLRVMKLPLCKAQSCQKTIIYPSSRIHYQIPVKSADETSHIILQGIPVSAVKSLPLKVFYEQFLLAELLGVLPAVRRS